MLYAAQQNLMSYSSSQYQQIHSCAIYMFHSSLAPTCFSLTTIIRKLTPILLKLITVSFSNVERHSIKYGVTTCLSV